MLLALTVSVLNLLGALLPVDDCQGRTNKIDLLGRIRKERNPTLLLLARGVEGVQGDFLDKKLAYAVLGILEILRDGGKERLGHVACYSCETVNHGCILYPKTATHFYKNWSRAPKFQEARIIGQREDVTS